VQQAEASTAWRSQDASGVSNRMSKALKIEKALNSQGFFV